jgi:uncharacterized protein DUF2760
MIFQTGAFRMNMIKSFSRRSFLWTLFVMILLALLFIVAGYYGRLFFFSVMPISHIQEAAGYSEGFKTGMEQLIPVATAVNTFYIPVVTGCFILSGLFLWLILRGVFVRLMKNSGLADDQKKKKTKKDKLKHGQDIKSEIDQQAVLDLNKRFYLHLISVLQREGRLVDFFSEDLSQYEDAQIGAAVRSIQENCKNALKKVLKPKAVIDQNEGDAVSVPHGFDPNAIKLTGNVTGEPPFQGVLRHKGWRASRIDLPTLSTVQDISIIAPAEVEIL